MAIDFPNSPATNATYTVGNKTWIYDGTTWNTYNTTSFSAETLPGTTLKSTVTGSSLTSVGTLSSLSVTGDLTVDTSTLKVDSTNNRVGIGTTSPQYALDNTGVTRSSDYIIGNGTKSVPRGIIASTTSSSNTLSGGIVTGLNTTFTAVAGRSYRISLKLVTSMPVGPCRILVTCANNRFIDWTNGAAGFPIFYSSWVTTFAAGSQSLQVAFNIIAGSPSLNAEASNQHQLIVEDIGTL